jgi:hypothetical protein
MCSGRHLHRYDLKSHKLHISEIAIFILYSKQRFTFLNVHITAPFVTKQGKKSITLAHHKQMTSLTLKSLRVTSNFGNWTSTRTG